MRFSKFIVAVVALAVAVTTHAQMPSYKNVGRAPTDQETKAWDISIGPDGKGLPPGNGTAKEGAVIFAGKCAVCHGISAEGKLGPQLSADKTTRDSLKTIKPVKSVGAYWPYATMVWDYINRAMPRNRGGSLTPNEVYALTAFVLYEGSIVQENETMDAKSLPKVQMPNRNGFVPPKFEDIPDEHKRGCTQGVCP